MSHPPPDGVRSATKIFDIGDTIHVRTTGNSPKGFKTPMFLYLMAKGKQVKSYEVSSGTITDIVIDQSMGLAPSASLLLWSLSTGGELVADEMEIFVSGLLKNTMSMEFNKKRQFVGQSVTLTVASKPNSDIFVVAIDKGSQILKEPNGITFDQTNEAIMKFDTREEKKDVNDWIRPMFGRRKRDTTQNYYSGTAAKNIMQTVGCVYITDGHVAEVQGQGGGIVFDGGIIAEAAAFPGSVKRKTDTGQTDQSVSSSTSSANQIRDIMFAMAESAKSNDHVNSNQGQQTETGQKGSESSNQIRTNFPETWIWLAENVGSDGTFQQDFTLPDTITSWTTRGFSISPEYGLGIASNIKVEGFKDFFVVVSLPASALRGEKVEVKLVVFNYYDTDKQVRLRLKHSNDFVIYDHKPTNISKPITGDFEKIFQVQAKMSKGERCYIESSGIGIKTLQVEASAGMVSGGTFNVEITDTVLKKIPIDPEGKKIYGGYQKLFDAESSPLKLRPMFPLNYVPDSRDLTVGVTGDIMGKALANTDKLLRVPSGCGEQNMIGLVPNIYVLLYMEANSITNAEIKDKAIQNMKRGYQRELNYKHKDGGFSAFGDSDPSFSTWLTAFVMKAFAQASKFIFVDDKVLKEAKEALMSKSGKDGSFREDGKVHHNDLNAGTSGGEMLTAYVYVAIMETKKAGSAIDSFDASMTLTYLENFYTTSKNSLRVRLTDYQLAVLSYCFALGNSQKLDLVLADLDGSSTKPDDGEMTCWCDLKVEEIDKRKSYWSYPPKPTAIETAAYVLLAYIEKNDLNKGLKVVKWLMTQSNSNGGFASTQDTMMALQALSKYAELVSRVDRNLNVKFRTAGLTDVVFNINNDNFLMLQQEDLKNNINEITQKGVEIIVQGTGNVVASLNWEYNLDIDDKFEELKVTVETFEIDEFTTQIRTCVWYTGNEDTGMVVVNVGLITGYTLTSLDKLQKEGGIKRVENNVNKLDIYFDQITASRTCFSVETVQEYIVIEHKSQPVSAYLYYAPEKSTTVYYDFNSVIKPTGDTVGLSSCNIILMFMTLISTTFTMVQF